MSDKFNRLSHYPRRQDARVEHGAQVLLRVATVDGAPRQIDHNIRTLNRVRPAAEALAIPVDSIPRFVRLAAREKRDAVDAPAKRDAVALGRLLYLAHLGVILWWLLDRSPKQRATHGLVALLGRVLPMISLALRLPPVRGILRRADGLAQDGLLGEG